MEASSFKWGNPGWENASSLQCPTCIKLGLEPSYFWGKECFQEFWPLHKLAHKKKSEKSAEIDSIGPIEDGFKYTGPLRRFKVTPKRTVPDSIVKPDYHKAGQPYSEIKAANGKEIPVYNEEEIEGIRLAWKIGRTVLDEAHKAIRAGVTTDEIDRIVHETTIENDAYPSPLNYCGFPKSVWTSINEVICHGIPDLRPLQDGDIINVDVSVYKNGFHGDLNETYWVGEVAQSSKDLVTATYDSLMKAIETCKPGQMYRNVGNVISDHVEDLGFSVVRTYIGHGVGKLFHWRPDVPHYRGNKAVGFMKPGHIFTIEPMINAGGYKDYKWYNNRASTWKKIL